ncbi:hypothetical protein JTE90_020728 [Oedothorax gibbosus]|uniref:UBC core domain-containing protein n=1 Tax=Oedothorax gibbosus TaxID=931172 RepID=A0AAV6V4M2_9ARAC|nr:hypothetical protein JTE90_020728 [Oedothorax gibbosus]
MPEIGCIGFAVRRIQRECQELNQSEEASQYSVNIEVVNDRFLEVRGEFTGPPGTSYEGGRFILKMNVSENYPVIPPEVRFVTKIWHPNISSVTGAIGLDILQYQWPACAKIRTILLSLQILLATPEPDEPQDAVVAKQFIEDPWMFELTARHWTQAYAGAPKTQSSMIK